jgi:hypothetical protein
LNVVGSADGLLLNSAKIKLEAVRVITSYLPFSSDFLIASCCHRSNGIAEDRGTDKERIRNAGRQESE